MQKLKFLYAPTLVANQIFSLLEFQRLGFRPLANRNHFVSAYARHFVRLDFDVGERYVVLLFRGFFVFLCMDCENFAACPCDNFLQGFKARRASENAEAQIVSDF